MTLRPSDSRFLAQTRPIVADLYQRKPLIYWTDFLVSLTIGYSAAYVYTRIYILPLQIVCFLIAGLALYRVALFMHEIVHLRKGELPLFSIAWNLLAGAPLLMPSFFYEPHRDHHNSRHYGTDADGEYLPLGHGPLRDIGLFLAQVFLQPIFVAFRFAILTPISFLHPKLRTWVLEHASSFVIDWRYRRRIPDNAPRTAWAVMDVLCCMRAIAIFTWVIMGWAPLERLPMLYFLATFILGMNYIRTLAAHRYESHGERLTHVEQLLDSIDITGDRFFTELMCPVGLRYHALHHLFPGLPYHNLGIAHRRLMAELPADSPYREVVRPSMRAVIGDLLRKAADHSRSAARISADRFQPMESSFVRLADGTHADPEPVEME
jgi:fatty acid desaturase